MRLSKREEGGRERQAQGGRLSGILWTTDLEVQTYRLAARALGTHRASSFLGSWRALPSAWVMEPKWLMFPT